MVDGKQVHEEQVDKECQDCLALVVVPGGLSRQLDPFEEGSFASLFMIVLAE